MSNTIYTKLLSVQKEVGAIKKDSKNPFFKSMYFDINSLLAEVKPKLHKHGLLMLQGIQANESGNMITTEIIDVETGEKIESDIKIPENADPQKVGSIITYFRRYALQSLLALEAEDDDGNTASLEGVGLTKGEPSEMKNIYKTKPASEKQKDMIRSLCLEKNIKTDNEFLEKMTSYSASQYITKLMKMPTQGKTKSEEQSEDSWSSDLEEPEVPIINE